MGVCRLHWPSDTSMKSVNGKLRPDSPPTKLIFPGCPDSLKRQACPTRIREVESRGVSSAACSMKKDELVDFDQNEKCAMYFKTFIEKFAKESRQAIVLIGIFI